MGKYIFALVFALVELVTNPVGAAEMVVVVNAGSGIDRLSREQVLDIFFGRLRQFPSGLAAEPIDQPDDSPAKVRFYRLLVNKEVAEINAYWARLVFSGRTPPPLKTEYSSEVHRLIASKRGGISYVERSQVDPRMTVVLSLGND